MVERGLSTLPVRVTFLRPGWYLENVSWDLPTASESGVIQSFLVPLDRSIPMVSTRDVGRIAAQLIQQEKPDRAIVELEGPRRVSPNDLAAAFARVLRSPVRAQAAPRNTWEALFRSQGMKNPIPRMRMLDGFNGGWIDFAGAAANTIRDASTLTKSSVRWLSMGANVDTSQLRVIEGGKTPDVRQPLDEVSK